MTTVTLSEIEKDFARYEEMARQRPVRVTKDGEDSVVLISAEAYARYRRMDNRVACRPEDLPDDLKKAIRDEYENLRDVEEFPAHANDRG